MLLHRSDTPLALALTLGLTIMLHVSAQSAEHGGGQGCTDPAPRASSSPACQASWGEVRTTAPKYSIDGEYACVRGYDCWCARGPECRCHPPGGKVIVKKKLYKADGDEKVEKVPKYEVKMQPSEPCDCARCQGVCFWNPLAVLHYLLHH